MFQDRLDQIEDRVRNAANIPEDAKAQLLGILADLKAEVATLATTHDEDARSIARFADVSTKEATRSEKKPKLVDAALEGLTGSVEGFETTHPHLTQLVNRLAVILSNVGI